MLSLPIKSDSKLYLTQISDWNSNLHWIKNWRKLGQRMICHSLHTIFSTSLTILLNRPLHTQINIALTPHCTVIKTNNTEKQLCNPKTVEQFSKIKNYCNCTLNSIASQSICSYAHMSIIGTYWHRISKKRNILTYIIHFIY